MPKEDDSPYYMLSTVVRAVAVLEQFMNSEAELGVTEVASRVKLHKSIVHRLIATLAELGLLANGTSPGTYRLGVKALELGLSYMRHSPLERVSQHHLTRLAQEIPDMASHVAILDGTQIVYQKSVSGSQTGWLSSTVGRRQQAYSTALGKVLLAYQSPNTVESYLSSVELTPFTQFTITSPSGLREEFTEIRSQGWSHDRQENMLDHVCVGAPIRDHTGYVIAAVSLAGLESHFEKYGLQTLVDKVRSVAAAISRDLGFLG